VAGREWVKWLADHQQEAVSAVRAAEERWRSLIPSDYGEQVHRVGARFAILEAALLLGNVITGWDEQTCRDAIQYSYNAWLREFGTGNKEHQQIIEQTEAFLNAYGMSRFAPFPYDPTSLPSPTWRDTGRKAVTRLTRWCSTPSRQPSKGRSPAALTPSVCGSTEESWHANAADVRPGFPEKVSTH
jgi:uncharacterized protein (DUF927 family)